MSGPSRANAPAGARRPKPAIVLSDRVFNVLLLGGVVVVLAMIAVIGASLAAGAAPAMKKFGWRFLIGRQWDPVSEQFGALPFIYGTLVTSVIALLIAVPVGLGAAVFLARVAPGPVASVLSFLIELLVAIPSVVLGLWGIFVLAPLLQKVEAYVGERWGDFPLFSGPPVGVGILAAGLILAIMILPFVVFVARDAIASVPRSIVEAGFALGATHWEVIRGPIFRYARKGIIAGIMLALGRALGETMAVTMVIGNTPQIPISIFDSGYTMAAVLANEFAEATTPVYISALVEIALVLLGITIVMNVIARLLMAAAASPEGG